MKLKSYLIFGLAALTLASCDDSFGDWVTPADNTQGDIANFGAGSVTPVSTIDFRTVADSIQTLKVCDIVAPTATDTAYNNITYQIKFGDQAYNIDANGEMSRSDLETFVNNKWGKRPVERTTKAAIVANVSNGATATRFTSDSIDVKTIAKAPVISSAYYIVGGALDWAKSAADRSQKFNHSSADVYDDPVFTITIPAAASGDTWFAVGSEEACQAIADNADGAWSQLLGTTKGNGANGIDVTEKIDYRYNLKDDGSFCVPASTGAKYIQVTIDMMDQTINIHPLNFNEFIYEIGGDSSWGTSNPLYGAKFDGTYLGYYYLNGEFKFKPNKDDWTGDWEYNGDGKIADNGGSNIPDPGAGYYRITVNLADMTYNLMKVDNISVIGNNNDWNTDFDMTYNTTTGNWEWTGDLSGDGIKFRVNHDWTYSWGGKASGSDYDNLTENNGNNLVIPQGAGRYKVTLTVHQENGGCKVQFEKL